MRINGALDTLRSLCNRFGDRLNRYTWGRRFNHHHAGVILTGIAVSIACHVAGILTVMPDWIMWTPMVCFVLIIAASCSMWYHLRSYCDLCVVQVMTRKSLDYEAAARRKSRQLRLTHRLNWRFTVIYMIAIAATIPLGWWYSALYATIIDDLLLLLFGYIVVATRNHQRLQPWCPQCKEKGIDNKIEAPMVPTPQPA
jgi:hypothetical protein